MTGELEDLDSTFGSLINENMQDIITDNISVGNHGFTYGGRPRFDSGGVGNSQRGIGTLFVNFIADLLSSK